MDSKTVKQLLESLSRSFENGDMFALDEPLAKLAGVSAEFSAELSKHDTTALITLRDRSYGRLLTFKGGVVTGTNGTGKSGEIEMVFEDEALARKVLSGLLSGKMDAYVAALKNGS